MSDQDFVAGTSHQPSSQPSAGAMLRAARDKQGLHIAALAASIKVAPRKLEALENDRWDELPDATFTRALAQTVCRTLKIDARPVLDLLPSAAPAPLGPTGGGLNMPFRERSGRDDPGIGSAAIKPMVWVAALLMVAAVVVYFLPENLWTRTPAADTAAPSPAAVSAVAPAASATAGAVPGASAASSLGPAVPDAVRMAASASPVAQPMVDAVGSAPQSGEAATAAGTAAAPAGLLQVRTSRASWVEVRDGRNQILLSRTVLPGESVGLDGSLPLRLTIGNAAATQLGFRGRPVDLASMTRDNVARLELQ